MDATYNSGTIPENGSEVVERQEEPIDNTNASAQSTESEAKTISERKLAANRENGGKSHGPKTIEGKERSSQSAIKHGLLAKRAVITVGPAKEDEAEFHALLQELRDYYQPHGFPEEIDVQELAVAYWKKARAAAAESGAIQFAVHDVPQSQSGRRKDSADFSKKALGLIPSAVDALLQNTFGIEYFLSFLNTVEVQLNRQGPVELTDTTAELLKALGIKVIGSKTPEILQALSSVREKLIAAKSDVGKQEESLVQAEIANLSIPPLQSVNNLVRYTTANDRRLEKIRERLERNLSQRRSSEAQQTGEDQSRSAAKKLQ